MKKSALKVIALVLALSPGVASSKEADKDFFSSIESDIRDEFLRQDREFVANGRKQDSIYTSVLDGKEINDHLKKDPSLLDHFSSVNPESTIASNRQVIDANKQSGEMTDEYLWDKIQDNSMAIQGNTSGVKANVQKIDANKQAIDENANNIMGNAERIANNAAILDKDIKANKQTGEMNAKNVKLNTQAINANVKSLGALTDDVALFKAHNENRVTKIEGRTTALEGRMTTTESKVSKLEKDSKRTKGALASTAALIQTANTPSNPGKIVLNTGVGHYDGATAVAVGVAGSVALSENTNMGYNLGVGMSSHQKGPVVRVGTSIDLN